MSALLPILLLTVLLWLILLAAVAAFRKWWTLLALNTLPALLTIVLFVEGDRLGRNEDTDQAAVGVLMMAGFSIYGIVISLASSAFGAVSGTVVRHFSARHIRIQQEDR